MKSIYTLTFAALTLGAASLVAFADKKPLDHDAFDAWKSVKVHPLSNDGRWAAYSVDPQEGDGVLMLRNTRKGSVIEIERGYKPVFTADSRYAIALIKPHFSDTRQAKIKKKKDFDLPQDSLAIVDLLTGRVERIGHVTSYITGEKGGDWVAWLSCDTTFIKPKHLKDKDSGAPLMVRRLSGGDAKMVKWVTDYTFSKDGMRLAAQVKPHESDSAAVSRMVLLNLPDTTEHTLLDKMKFYGKPVFSEASDRVAFTASTDSATSGTRRARLYEANLTATDIEPQEVYLLQTVNEGRYPVPRPPHVTDPAKRDSVRKVMRDKLASLAGDSIWPNQYTTVRYSHDGRRLIAGVAPYVAPDDTTIVDFEQADLDIWRWDAPYTPPQEKANLKELRAHEYPIVIDLASGRGQLLSSSVLETVVAPDRWDADWALVRDPSRDIVSQQWNYSAPEELYIVNVNTGERRKVADVPIFQSEMSPSGRYVVWFADRQYHVYDVAADATRTVSAGVPFPLWDEDNNTPMPAEPYGIAGWLGDDDTSLLVYDRHDIWMLDPKGEKAPVNMTAGQGRKDNRRYRYHKLDKEERHLAPEATMMLDVFDYTTKQNGLASAKAGRVAAPGIMVLENYMFTQLRKAKNVDVYAFQKANFSVSPDVYIAKGNNFRGALKVTDANPQMKDYRWGTAQLEKWYSYNGDPTEGVLYVPEDLDPNKKYPMLVVFYETQTEELFRHYTMEPSWSWVNYPFYVSRGYVVLVPDVKYFAGLPGESAYNYICSGVEEMCRKYPWIDKDRIGIDGQSWGGYQTAFLVTRTDMFACAGSGAPVSNMTSAYGGIRWGSGDSRQAQYENGQSRIGRNLWEAPELYIANSPIFHADRVNTPLLIMHNDDDGAVPWYQGIEYFMALRRLEKPVWMLQYNGEAHNIRARKNRKDITRRLQQFFDHYLKDEPMPRWMKDGISPLRKGQDLGF